MMIPARFISATMDLPSGVNPCVHRRFGLYVADLIDVVVHHRDRAHAVAKGFMHAIQPVFDEVSAFHGENRAGLAAPMRGVDVGGSQSRAERRRFDEQRLNSASCRR